LEDGNMEKIANRVSTIKGSAIREIFKVLANGNIISFAGGAPDPALFPADLMSDLAAGILKNEGALALSYGITEGYNPLKEEIIKRLKSQNIISENDNFIITTGGQQVIDLAAKSLVNEFDKVVVEDPSFIGGLNSFRSYNAKLIPAPVLDDGLDLDYLEEKILKKEKIKLLYTIPTFQNPSGITMSLEKRKNLLDLAEKYDFLILEDNPYGELRFMGEDIPTIKSLDKLGRVIYAGSLSKVLSPGLRIGFCAADKIILEKMIVCKQVSDVHTPVLNQMLAHRVLCSMDFDKHIQKAQKLYGEKCAHMLACMDKYFPQGVKYTRPEGGIFIWVDLKKDIDTKELLKVAVERGVAFVPGATCMVDIEKPSNKLRLNYSLSTFEQIEKGIKILAEIL